MSDDLVIFVRCDNVEEKRAFASAGPIANGVKTNTLTQLHRATMSSPPCFFLMLPRRYSPKDYQFCAS